MRNQNPSSLWVLRPKPSPTAALRLFCFPPAGGGASNFWAWKDDLPPEVELCAIQLPGREARLKEPPLSDVTALMQSLTSGLLPELDRPFAFFGHSIGALISFELARALRRSCGPAPCHLFVAARPAPQLPRLGPRLARLPDKDLLAVLRRTGALPAALAGEATFLRMILPTWRADLALSENYAYTAEVPFAFPITAFGGISDASVGRAELMPWRSHSSERFELRMLPGNHLFPQSSRAALVRLVLKDLEIE